MSTGQATPHNAIILMKSLHLPHKHNSMLEATFILSMDPVLCRQKEFVHSLILFQHGNIKAVAPTAVQGMHANGKSSALGVLVLVMSHHPVLCSS